ncbi:MAG: NAD(P)-binding domain-containing protein [Cyclobacteriaceae bacterium]|nr:NAD(P)-binding domain-containing protein [Cyclobacteriaceae bacterium]
MISCLVIGAGPAGIVTTKELLEQGVDDVLCLEQAPSLGGTFSKSYDSLVLTSSVTFSMFSDFWVGDGKDHHFWTKNEGVDYWTEYARHFKVIDHIRFQCEVTEVRDQADQGWKVSLASGEVLQCQRLALAIGNNRVPRFPEWGESLNEIACSHSHEYRNPDSFQGKRVLVVGGGESGSDVAFEISQVAEKSWISLRESTGWVVPRKRGGHAADVSTHRGIWDLPREFGAKLSPFVLKLERARQDPVFDALADLNDRVRAQRGIWGIYGTKTLALPKAIANHGCQVVGDVVDVEEGGRLLKTADGESLENVDAVVFCTGYHNRAGFMPPNLQSCDPRKLYKHMFHSQQGDRLAWIGWARPAFGSQFPIMEMQARYCALVFTGRLQLPEPNNMVQVASEDEEVYGLQFEDNALRIRSLVDYHRYMDNLANIIGCKPSLSKYFLINPRLWLHLMYGPTQATQFRLRGPGKKVKLAHKILMKLPISTFNHIVKAGLRGRIYYALRAIVPDFLLPQKKLIKPPISNSTNIS